MPSIQKHVIDLRTAHEAIQATIAKATELGVEISVAVTDQDGSIKASSRMDGASSITAEIALNKAYTGASLRMATHELYNFVKNDPPLLHGFSQYPRIIIFGGGYPIKEAEEVIGGIGVSGGHYSQDIECALAGLAAIDMGRV
ncbi:MAG TPA: heme-binding protein [Rhizomicrobium sp.]|jgi:uncharacterized protein GlcG (DUF336 family)|nr:heme-binding protein [Rhizomicrobium sp.]